MGLTRLQGVRLDPCPASGDLEKDWGRRKPGAASPALWGPGRWRPQEGLLRGLYSSGLRPANPAGFSSPGRPGRRRGGHFKGAAPLPPVPGPKAAFTGRTWSRPAAGPLPSVAWEGVTGRARPGSCGRHSAHMLPMRTCLKGGSPQPAPCGPGRRLREAGLRLPAWPRPQVSAGVALGLRGPPAPSLQRPRDRALWEWPGAPRPAQGTPGGPLKGQTPGQRATARLQQAEASECPAPGLPPRLSPSAPSLDPFASWGLCRGPGGPENSAALGEGGV